MSGACDRCAFALEAEDLRCSLCGLATTAPPTPVVTKARAEIMRCVECGAAVTYSVEVRAPHCAFCKSTMRLEALTDPVDQAQWLLPFAADPAAARAGVKAWLGSRGFFRPGDLAEASTVEELRPVWWPAWVFDASAEVSWTADSNANARRARWAPHAGECVMDFEAIVLTASRGLSEEECRTLIPSYDLGPAVEADAGEGGGPEGSLLERFDVQRSAARRRIVEAIQSTAVARVMATEIPGSSFRKVRASVMLNGLTTHRYALPAYVLAYRYRKKLYRVVVHGQDPRQIVGDSPISWLRVAAVVLCVALALALVAALLSSEPQPPPPVELPPPGGYAPLPPPPVAPPPPTGVDHADDRCFFIEASGNSPGTSELFARRGLSPGGTTWDAVLRRAIARRMRVLDPRTITATDLPTFGSQLAVRLGHAETWVVLHDEGDAEAVCAGTPEVRDLLRNEYGRLNWDADALAHALGHERSHRRHSNQ